MTAHLSTEHPRSNCGVSIASLLSGEEDSDVQFVGKVQCGNLLSCQTNDINEKNEDRPHSAAALDMRHTGNGIDQRTLLESANTNTTSCINSSVNFACDPVASLLFNRDEVKQKFRISRNIYAEHVDIASAPPAYFPVSANGFATFVNLDGYDVHSVQEFVEGSPYSVRGKAEKKSSVILRNDTKYSVWRKTVTCSGIKACSTSLEKCSKPHFGPWEPSNFDEDLQEDATVDWEYEKALQVFFCGQNMFPIVCKHVKVRDTIDSLRQTGDKEDYQQRLPNWVFKEGKRIYFSRNVNDRIGRSKSSKLPDYFGCADFGKPGVTNSKKCDLVPLPASLQGANPDLVEEICARARQGIFPTSKRSKGDCPPMRVTYSGKHCPRSIHLQETCLVRRLECEVEYHYLFHQLEDKSFSWVIVVGTGVHKHAWPLARPPPSLVKSFVSSMCSSDPSLTSKQIERNVEMHFGLKAPLNTIQKLRYRMVCEIYPFGKSLQALLAAYKVNYGNKERMYIRRFVDETHNDGTRVVSEQMGVSVVLCNYRLLKQCSRFPRLGCDGTFQVFCSYEDGMNFELNSIVAKDPSTGKLYSPMRQLSSRKTTAARKILFEELIAGLVECGLQDPVTAPIEKRLSMATDFETTYALALGHVLAETFRSESYLTYIQYVCHGCDVHAKRAILEKCDAIGDNELYQWAVGTRRVSTKEEVEEALSVMKGIGGKWGSFAEWLKKNKIAFILWFLKHSSKVPLERLSDTVFWDTNVCEAGHSRIKSLHQYLLSNRRGLPFVEAVKELEKMDGEDADNIGKVSPADGIQYCSTPAWKRAQALGRKRQADSIIIIDDEPVTASQPKKAKRVTKQKNETSADSIIESLQRATQALQSQIPEIHSMLSQLLQRK